jgi:hypothetical protein
VVEAGAAEKRRKTAKQGQNAGFRVECETLGHVKALRQSVKLNKFCMQQCMFVSVAGSGLQVINVHCMITRMHLIAQPALLAAAAVAVHMRRQHCSIIF